MDARTLEVHSAAAADWPLSMLLEGLQDAIDLASDQDTITWLTDRGKRIAAIVPVDVAERAEAGIAAVLATPLRPGEGCEG